MKIGFLSFAHLTDWTGITRLIDQIAAGMVERGHEVVIIAQEGAPSDKVPVSPRAYPHELLALDFTSSEGRAEARRKIAQSGIDICLTSVGDKRLVYVPGLFWESNIPLVIGDPADPGVLTYERWHPYIRFGALASADAIQILLPQYVNGYPSVLRAHMVAIGNPVPVVPPFDMEARRNKPVHTVMFAGRLNESDKRVSLLMRAFAILSDEFENWNLKIVGDGPFWEFYQEMARQLGLTRRIEFTGGVGDPEVHYAQADIFCLPSGRAEGFPMVFLEAAAHALPLVGFRTCVAAAALIDEGMGTVVDSPDGDTPEALAEALRRLMALTPLEREAMGSRARDGFMQSYREEIILSAWEELLEQTYARFRHDGMTKLEKMRRNLMLDIDSTTLSVFEGLEPDSQVWTEEALNQAAREIARRADPAEEPTASQAPEQIEVLRLRSELAEQKLEYQRLERKHAALLAQFQANAATRQKSVPKKRRKR